MYKTHLTFVALLAAALGSGVVGSLFFALARISAAERMNSTVVVVHSNFMLPFLGTALLCVALIVRSLFLWKQPAARYALAAGIVYLFGCVVILCSSTWFYQGLRASRLRMRADCFGRSSFRHGMLIITFAPQPDSCRRLCLSARFANENMTACR